MAFPLQPVVQLRDASNNAVSQLGVVVTAALATGSPTLGGTLTATTNASGVATFTNLAITGMIGDRTLSFVAPSLTGVTSGTVTVTAGAASQLTLTTAPSASVQSGIAFPQQPVLQLRDASSNAVSQLGVVVTAALATGSPTLGGTLTATTNASGVATFTNLAITGTIGDRTLSFVAPSLTGVTSGTVTVGAGAASQLTLTTAPSASVQSGIAFPQQPVLQLRDASGNAVSQLGVVVTAALATGSPTLGGTLTATTNASGVATFTNLAITGVTGDRTLSFAAPSLTGVTSGTVTVTAGAASQLSFTQQPSAVAAGALMSPAVTVTVEDAQGNPVTAASGTVSLALTVPGGATLTGGSAATVTNGVATFAGLSVDRVGSYTLTPSTTVAGVTTLPASGSFAVSVGAATQYLVTVSDTNPVAGTVITVSAQLADANDNPVATLGIVVTWSSTSSTSPGTFSFPTSTTDTAGLATVTFTTSATSGTIHTVTATDASNLTGTRGNIATQ